jgi:mRNA interferase RelE/StbE
MKAAFLASFLSDVKKVRDGQVRRAVAGAIENVEQAADIEDIRSLKRLSGQRNYYRIRIGDWRIGVRIEADEVTFVRCLHRREVYRFFP